MVEILSPRPAATVITVRDGPNGYEILMLRRNLNSDFVGGAYVFPGGRVDEADAGTLDFISMMERERLVLDLRGLEYVAHWVTPVGPPRRFDTRFFVALAPSRQVATHDAGETVADQWIRPVDALAANA